MVTMASIAHPEGQEPTPYNDHSSSHHHRRRSGQLHHRHRSRDRQSVQVMAPQPTDSRLSSTERIYSDPIAAQEAFAAERADNPLHRRAPTPHTSRRTRGGADLQRSDSAASFRSNASGRSRRSVRTVMTGDEQDVGGLAPDEPHFGASRGIGPAGEAIEVIGLGRKEPRHRTYSSTLLKPALRSGPSRDRMPILDDDRPHQPQSRNQNKPLPNRPRSLVVSVNEGPAMNPSYVQVYHPTPPADQRPEASHSRHALQAAGGLRSLFSSLSIEPALYSANSGPRSSGLSRQRSSRRKEIIHPADDLFTYLRVAEVPPWTSWPGDRDTRKSTASLSLFGNTRSKGYEAMPWAWHRRLELAEASRQGRALMSWESIGRHWEKRICEWLDDNVPSGPIDPANRWGSQIFALPAEGYDTVEFFDEAADEADDFGLLSWLTGSVLQTAVSVLHMLRYSSQGFSFHLIPSATPTPYPTENLALWDGFGTLALVDKSNDLDRAMIIEVRPPSIVGSSVLRDFVRPGRAEGWWQLPGQYCVGDVGQANLLQAQVYDSCVQNQVYFFAVTNIKYWVFGYFNTTYTKCYCGPVIDRKQHDPGALQCLTAWIIRAVDERPRRDSAFRLGQQEGHGLSHRPSIGNVDPDHTQNREDIMVYPDERSQRRPSHSRHASHHSQHRPSQTPISPYPQPGYNCSQMTIPFNSYPQMEYGQGYGGGGLPGYYDPHQTMTSPPPAFPGTTGMGYNTWPGAVPQRGFTPVPVQGDAYGMGNWYQGMGWPMR